MFNFNNCKKEKNDIPQWYRRLMEICDLFDHRLIEICDVFDNNDNT